METSKKIPRIPQLLLFETLDEFLELERETTTDQEILKKHDFKIDNVYEIPRAFIVGEQAIGKSTLLNTIAENASVIDKKGQFIYLHKYRGGDFLSFLTEQTQTKDFFTSDLVLCLSGLDEVKSVDISFLVEVLKTFVDKYLELPIYISSTTDFILRNEGFFREFGDFKWIKLMPPYVDSFPDYAPEKDEASVTKESKAEEPISGPNYWWINANPRTWKFNSISEGEETYYSTHTSDGKERKVYRNFSAVKTGDLAIGYETTPTKKVIAILEITKPKHTEGSSERISFKIQYFVDKQVSRKELLDIPELADIQALRIPGGSLFKLTEQEFDRIVDLTKAEEKEEFVPYYNMDGYTGVDKLDIDKDVHAFASLIAYKDLDPPLAVGLFGNWGAGKTFFMNRLEEEIDELIKEDMKNETHSYCRDVVHVKFNAWHYSDANLWACLVITIFEELNKYAQEKGKGEVKSLKQVLNEKIETSRIILREAKEGVKRAKGEQKKAHDNYKKFATKRKELCEILQGAITDSVTEELLANTDFKKDVLNPLSESIGEDAAKDARELKEAIKSIRTIFRRFFRSIKMLREQPKLLIITFAISLLAFIVPAILISIFFKETQLDWVRLVNKILPILSVLLVPLRAFLRYFKRINQNFEKFSDFVNHEAEISQENVNIALENYKKAQENYRNAQQELKDIKSGKRLMEFIEERSKSLDYNKHLGIVSIIRKDFDALKKELTLTENEKSDGKGFNVDRIILYIDDLDRCPKEKVVQVLEAIHLILALDLFVVIVGVDPRWVSKSLYFQYSQLLKQQDEDFVLPKDKEKKDESSYVGDKATSIDYLEKIFQIPFVLKPIENQAKINLLDHLFEDQIVVKKTKTGKGVEEGIDRLADSGKISEDELGEGPLDTYKLDLKKKKEKVEALEVLRITEDELEFMKFITPILGDTPRNIKRYANIYRIIRAHPEIPEFSKENFDDFRAMMFLLAVVVGNGPIASSFLKELMGTKNLTLKTFLVNLGNQSKFKKSDHYQNILNYMTEKNDSAPKSSVLQLKKINNLKTSMLRQYVPIVSRFSFRTIESV